jgi:glycosyltransferase 2 family protein
VLRRKRFWFGFIIAGVFLAFFLVRIDFEEIRQSFAGADYVLAIASVPLYFVGFWFRTLRWHLLLKPIADIPTTRLYPVVLIGLMSNNVAPARIGEVVRAYLVGNRESISKSTALGTIALDRVFDGLTLVAILGVMTIVSGADAGVKSLGVGAALIFAAGTGVLVAMAMSPARVRHWLSRFIRLLPERFGEAAERLVDSFLSGLVVIRSPSILLLAAFVSLVSWLLEASMYYVVGEAFHLDVGFDAYLIVTAASNLALSVFASPGGVGPFEVTAREVLTFFGARSADASAYALALHALLLGPVILIGILLIWTSRISMSEIMGVRESPATSIQSTGRSVE